MWNLVSAAVTSAQVSPSVTLTWDQSCNTNVIGYCVYYTTNTLPAITNIITSGLDDCGNIQPSETNVYHGNWSLATAQNIIGINNVMTTVTNLSKGKTYYFFVTCKTAYLESDKSIEVSHTVPLFPTNIPPSKVRGPKVLSVQ